MTQLPTVEFDYRSIVEAQTDFIVRCLPDGTRTFANTSYCNYYGLTQKEVIGTSFYPLISDEDIEDVKRLIGRLTPQDPVTSEEHRVIRKDGSIGWNHWVTRGIFDEHGHVTEYQSVGRDITPQRAVEDALRQSEERFRTLYTKTPVMLHSIDANFLLVSVSDLWLEKLGYERSEVLGHDPAEYLTPPSRIYALDVIRPILMKSGTLKDMEFQYQKKDGGHIDVQLSIIIEKGDDGKLLRAMAVSVDVTDRKEAEQALRKSEERSSQLLRSVPDSVTVTSLETGRIVEVNKGFEEMFGFRRDEAIGKTTLELGLWVDPDQREEMARTLREGKPLRGMEVNIRAKDGQESICEIYGDTIELDGERCLMAVARDITERKQSEAKIAHLQKQLELENEYLRKEVREIQHLGHIVGQSPAIQNVLKQVELVAPTDSNVLIEGESGTGKELMACAIHEKSARRDRPMITVNCASIPRELFESEFFGHIKGSFTGALRDRAGRFELADEGTLFLDEIGEIPLELQSKLLRALQGGEVSRVGAEKPVQFNVRIIAATNRNLGEELKAKRFREDLYYRLSVFPISVPPLRDRMVDIPPLAEFFLSDTCRRLGVPQLKLRNRHVQQLKRYSWPGNVRELQNIIERAVITAQSGVFRLDLPEPALPEKVKGRSSNPHVEVLSDAIMSRSELKQVEKQNIRIALAQCGGKVYGPGGAAEILDMNPSTLASRIRKLCITRSDRAT